MNQAAFLLLAKHRASHAKGYPFLLVFERVWTHGTALAGMSMLDSLPFCTQADAVAWVESINAQHAKSFAKKNSRMTYKVTTYTVEAT